MNKRRDVYNPKTSSQNSHLNSLDHQHRSLLDGLSSCSDSCHQGVLRPSICCTCTDVPHPCLCTSVILKLTKGGRKETSDSVVCQNNQLILLNIVDWTLTSITRFKSRKKCNNVVFSRRSHVTSGIRSTSTSGHSLRVMSSTWLHRGSLMKSRILWRVFEPLQQWISRMGRTRYQNSRAYTKLKAYLLGVLHMVEYGFFCSLVEGAC